MGKLREMGEERKGGTRKRRESSGQLQIETIGVSKRGKMASRPAGMAKKKKVAEQRATSKRGGGLKWDIS